MQTRIMNSWHPLCMIVPLIYLSNLNKLVRLTFKCRLTIMDIWCCFAGILFFGLGEVFQSFLRITLTCAISIGVLALGVGTATGYISPWTGPFYSLLDPTYVKDHIPIIASVSEHQPTALPSFMFDFHILLFLFPVGLFFCFKRLSDATIFIVMYGLTILYFAGVMVRLILVATPAVCLISAIAISATVKNLTSLVRETRKATQAVSGKGSASLKASSKVRICVCVIT